MNNIQLFENDEFNLEFIPDGDSFKVAAASLAHSLGFRDAWRLTQSIPDGEKGYTLASTPSGDQRVLVVTETGFYRALGQRQTSRIRNLEIRALVERFQAWVRRGASVIAPRRSGTDRTRADPAHGQRARRTRAPRTRGADGRPGAGV